MNHKTPLAAAVLAVAALSAQAGALQLTVTDKDGKPAPDVVVLVDVPIRPALSTAPVTATITQEGLKFQPFLTVVPVGSTVRFVNRDRYDHHVRSQPSGPLGAVPAAQTFELRLDAAEGAAGGNDDYQNPHAQPRKKSGMTQVDVKMDKAGPIGLGCHIHGSMRGQLFVSGTPWFAKTDADGIAKIASVPDGPIQVTLWHPDQLQDQAALRAEAGSAPLALAGQLNFVPRRRRN
ncbi:MAG: plastocyanin [Piscinibacter sp.]